MTCISHHSIVTEHFHCPKNPLCFVYSSQPTPVQILVTNDDKSDCLHSFNFFKVSHS